MNSTPPPATNPEPIADQDESIVLFKEATVLPNTLPSDVLFCTATRTDISHPGARS